MILNSKHFPITYTVNDNTILYKFPQERKALPPSHRPIPPHHYPINNLTLSGTMTDSALEPKPPRPKRATQLSSERCLQNYLRKIRWLIICAILAYLFYLLSTADDESATPSRHPYNTTPPLLIHLLVIFAIASLFDMLLGLVDDKKISFAIKTLPFIFVAAIALPVFFRLTRRDNWTLGGWVQGNGGEVNMLPTMAGLTGF
jgi:hypothetical protein